MVGECLSSFLVSLLLEDELEIEISFQDFMLVFLI
jgi:hypothetical protein